MSKIREQLKNITTVKTMNYPTNITESENDHDINIYNPLDKMPNKWIQNNELEKPIPVVPFPVNEPIHGNYRIKHGKEYVKDPPHYHSKCTDDEMKAIIDRINKRGYIQAIDVIDAFFKNNFNLASAFRYMSRIGGKDDELTEIDKASWYLNHERENIIAKRK